MVVSRRRIGTWACGMPISAALYSVFHVDDLAPDEHPHQQQPTGNADGQEISVFSFSRRGKRCGVKNDVQKPGGEKVAAHMRRGGAICRRRHCGKRRGGAGISIPGIDACGTVNIPAHLGHRPSSPTLASGACTLAQQVGQKKRIIDCSNERNCPRSIV